MAYDPMTAQLMLFGGAINATTSVGDTRAWITLSVLTASLAPATVGVPYAQTLQAISGTAPYTWSSAPGALPAGLTLSAAGVISGTPTAFGTASFTLTALDATTPTAISVTRAVTLQVSAAPEASVWVGNGVNSDVNAFPLTATR